MDDILYLLHCTNNKYYFKWDNLNPSKMDEHQFPGVYFSLITKYNLLNEDIYPANNILIFSKKLLEQQNYHINIQDYNGHINEKNTYYPWNLNEAIKAIKSEDYKKMNEVVFHDPIPFKYLCTAIIEHKISCNINNLLPNFPIFNNEKPDISKIPFYCYPYEMNYTGINKLNLSSKEFYIKMAKMCNIETISETREKIIEIIRENMEELYKNRQLLKLDEFN